MHENRIKYIYPRPAVKMDLDDCYVWCDYGFTRSITGVETAGIIMKNGDVIEGSSINP